MTLTLNVFDLADGGAAYEGAASTSGTCDRDGNYSLYSDGSRGRTTCAASRSPTPPAP